MSIGLKKFSKAKTAEAEVQEKDGLDHQRVYDPYLKNLLEQILLQLEIMNQHLQLLTEEEIKDEN